jgi:hypothetical protein
MSLLVEVPSSIPVVTKNEINTVKEEVQKVVGLPVLGEAPPVVSTPAVIQSESTIGGVKNWFMEYLPIVLIVGVSVYVLNKK